MAYKAKDPAFLFYPNDWLGGTLRFTRHLKGCYIDLLMAQFTGGRLSIDEISDVLGEVDFETHWEMKLKSKFKQDENGLFYNERLDFEINKRKGYTESRRKNKEGETTSQSTYADDLFNSDGTTDDNSDTNSMSRHMVNVNKSKIKIENKNRIKDVLLANEEFLQAWEIWLEYRTEIKKPYKSPKSEVGALQELSKYNALFAILLIERSILNSWQGLIFDTTDKAFKTFMDNGQRQTGTKAGQEHPLARIKNLAKEILHNQS